MVVNGLVERFKDSKSHSYIVKNHIDSHLYIVYDPHIDNSLCEVYLWSFLKYP